MSTHGLLMRDERDFFLQKLERTRCGRGARAARRAARIPLGLVLRPHLHGPRPRRETHGERVRHARVSRPAGHARRRRDDRRARRRDGADPPGAVRAHRPLPPSADGRAPVRNARRALGRPADHERRARAGTRRSSPPSAATSSTAAPSPRSASRSGSTRGRSRWLDWHGRFYEIADVSLEPKPVQKPHPPIVFGAVTEVGARRAARTSDGLYPMFLDAYADPGRFDELREDVSPRGRARRSRPLGLPALRIRVGPGTADAMRRRDRRRTLTGNAEQVLADLSASPSTATRT